MARCPNCYNSITPDTQNCPSCAYLLIQPERTPMSHLSAAAPAQARSTGRLETADYVRASGRLRAPEQPPPSNEGRPRGVRATPANGNRRRTGETRPRSRKQALGVGNEESRLRKAILIPLVVIGLGAAAVLLAPATQMISYQVDAATSISTLTTFRSQQSKQPGKTVDQYVNELLDESRKAGNLVRYSGWSIRTINFTKSKITLAFTFEEKDGVRTAEWLADVGNNTFTPKDDLAAQIYGKN